MFKAISICKPGTLIKDVGRVITEFVESNGYTILTEFGGHGVGKELHLPPFVSHGSNFKNI